MTIGGRSRLAADGATIDSTNPATGELIGRFPAAGPADVEEAVVAAEQAFESWRRTTPSERARAINALADLILEHGAELSSLDVIDNGSPIREMRNDVGASAEMLRYFAGIVHEAKGTTHPDDFDSLDYTLQQPYGVVGRIVPFNHPLMFAVQKIAAPLAAGNTVLLKPSEFTSLSALRLGELSRSVLPDGVFNVVTGYGRDAGDAIVRHPRIRRLAFTGSAPTGRAIIASAATVNVKHITLELGGKNPLVIFEDADLGKAIAAAKRGMNFTWQGQSCGSTSRLLVHADIYDAVLKRVVEKVRAIRLGDPQSPDTGMGPVNSRVQLEKVLSFFESARTDGARLMTGGKRPDGPMFERGFWVEPTVYADVEPGMRLWQEEQTGFLRCSSIASRMVRLRPSAACGFSSGTFGGGGGGGVPRIFSRTHFPRCTTEVRLG